MCCGGVAANNAIIDGWDGWHLSSIKRKVPPHILERISKACSMARDLFGVQVGMWNLSSLSGKGGFV